MLYAPAPFAVAVPTALAPAKRLTVALASVVPVKVGVVTFVMPSVLLAPLSLAADRVGAAGVMGGTVSIVTERLGDAALAFPATSTAFTTTRWTPSERSAE